MAQVTFTWTVKVYDLRGAELAQLTGIAGATLSFPLNGIDSLSLTLYLDNPLIDPGQGGDSTLVRELDRVVKVWRSVSDPDNGVSYSDPSDKPCFSGFITRIEKRAETNQMEVLCQNSYWLLQCRFHLLNHRLFYDHAGQYIPPTHYHEGGNQDGALWDVSAMCFRFIDLINFAFDPYGTGDGADGVPDNSGVSSQTGIIKPPAIGANLFWTKTVQITNGFLAARGNNIWNEIAYLLWEQSDGGAAAPDLVPEYVHGTAPPVPNDGRPGAGGARPWAQMYFKTAPYRGEDKSGTISYDYCIGNKNLRNLVETGEVVPGAFANYVWGVGVGGPNVARYTSQDVTGTYGIDNVGVYQFYDDLSSVVDRGVVGGTSALKRMSEAELKRRKDLPRVYLIEPAPLFPPYYGSHFGVGDVVGISGSKGALQVAAGTKKRMYEIAINLSENCVESYEIRVATDFFSKVPA